MIDVTILTGALGSGKTTLVNRIVNSDLSNDVAVVLNEFAPNTGIEKLISTAVLENRDRDKSEGYEVPFMELGNGCVCCSIKSELVQTLEVMVRKYTHIKHIIVECSGLADPGPVASQLWTDPELEANISLGSIVCLIDLYNFKKLIQSGVSLKQVSYADILILNKTDLVPVHSAEYDEIYQQVKQLNPNAQIINTLQSELSTEQVITMLEKKEEIAIKTKENTTHNHDLDIGYHTVSSKQALTKSDFEIKFGELLWEKCDLVGAELFRFKGILNVKDSETRHIVQGVYDTFEINASNKKWESDDKLSEIIFIGKNLEKLGLDRFLENNSE